MCVRARVRACVRACVLVCTCVRACVRVCVVWGPLVEFIGCAHTLNACDLRVPDLCVVCLDAIGYMINEALCAL